jgi:hypothetical protein
MMKEWVRVDVRSPDPAHCSQIILLKDELKYIFHNIGRIHGMRTINGI